MRLHELTDWPNDRTRPVVVVHDVESVVAGRMISENDLHPIE